MALMGIRLYLITFWFFSVKVLATDFDRIEVAPSFDSVILRWQKIVRQDLIDVGRTSYLPENFFVKVCENPGRGNPDCVSKSYPSEFRPDLSRRFISKKIDRFKDSSKIGYSLEIGGLHLSTPYTITLESANGLSRSNVTFETTGFSASAIFCDPHQTHVQVETGPFFGGQVSVDRNDGPQTTKGKTFCFVNGNINSTQRSYTLIIDHQKCEGVMVTQGSVSASLTIQESLLIMTHSTKRFNITCVFEPTTLTVAPGLNVPQRSHSPTTGVGSVTKQVMDFEEETKEFKVEHNDRSSRKLEMNETSDVSEGSGNLRGNDSGTFQTLKKETFLVTSTRLVAVPLVDNLVDQEGIEIDLKVQDGHYFRDPDHISRPHKIFRRDDMQEEPDFPETIANDRNDQTVSRFSPSLPDETFSPSLQLRQSKDFKLTNNLEFLPKDQSKNPYLGTRYKRKNVLNSNLEDGDYILAPDSNVPDSSKSQGQNATPSVPHLVLIVIVIVSAIVGTGAATYWLVTNCQKKIACVRGKEPEPNASVLTSSSGIQSSHRQNVNPVYENVETTSFGPYEEQPKCISYKSNLESFL